MPLPTVLTSSGPLSAVAIQDTVVHSTEPLARWTRLVGTHPPNSQVLARKVCKSRDLGKLAGRAKGWLVYQILVNSRQVVADLYQDWLSK